MQDVTMIWIVVILIGLDYKDSYFFNNMVFNKSFSNLRK